MQAEQNPTERIKSSQKQLQNLRQKSTSLTDKDLEPILQELTKNKISYAIFLYANEFMDTLITSETKIKFNILALCKIYATSCLYELKPLKVTKYKLNNVEKMKEFEEACGVEKKKEFKISAREDQISKFLEAVAEAVQADIMKPTVADAIQKGFSLKGLQMQKKQQFTPYEQFSINYLNYCLQQIRQKFQQKNICCKTIFLHQQHISSGQGPSQQFKRYIWPINNASIKNHLTKTIVGFMNCKGGIIFIGIMENKEKRNQVVGINLKPTEVQPITDLFNNQLVGVIYPKHQGFENHKSGTTGGLVRNQYQINKFVKMEFTRVVDPVTFMNVETKKDGKYEGSLYIVKIVVKIGHPKHLYHIINTQKNIDFFQRKDRNVQKMQFPDAYNMIYKRLDQFQIFKTKYKNEQEINKKKLQQLQQSQRQLLQIQIHQQSISLLNRQLFHSHCRYFMDNIQWLLKEDNVNQEDDDDDDDD